MEPLLNVEATTMVAPASALPAAPTAHLSTMFSPGDQVVSLDAAQDWRCNGTRLQTPVTAAPWVRLCQGESHEGSQLHARGAGCRSTHAHRHPAATARQRPTPYGRNPSRRDLPSTRWGTERVCEGPQRRRCVRRKRGDRGRDVAARIAAGIGYAVRDHPGDGAPHSSRRARGEPRG